MIIIFTRLINDKLRGTRDKRNIYSRNLSLNKDKKYKKQIDSKNLKNQKSNYADANNYMFRIDKKFNKDDVNNIRYFRLLRSHTGI